VAKTKKNKVKTREVGTSVPKEAEDSPRLHRIKLEETLQVVVSKETAAWVRAEAEREFMPVSIWVRRLLEHERMRLKAMLEVAALEHVR